MNSFNAVKTSDKIKKRCKIAPLSFYEELKAKL